MATMTVAQDRIGELLVKDGLITREQLAAALTDARNNNSRVGYSLIKLGFISEEALTLILARQFHVRAVDLNRVEVDPRILRIIPADLARKHLVIPLRRNGRSLTVAMANPGDSRAISDLSFRTRHDIEPVIVGEYTLRKHLDKYYDVKEDHLSNILTEINESDIEFVESRDEDVSVASNENCPFSPLSFQFSGGVSLILSIRVCNFASASASISAALVPEA